MLAAAIVGSNPLEPANHLQQQRDVQVLEQKLRTLAGVYTRKTTLDDIGIALDTRFDQYAADKCYAGHCEIYFSSSAPSPSSYHVLVFQLSTDFIDWDRPWTAHDPTVMAEITTSDADTCFSVGEWNTALVGSGWEPLKPFVDDNRFIITGPIEVGKVPPRTTLHVHGYATRRDGIVIALTGPGLWRAKASIPEVDALQLQQSCMKTLYINGYQDFYDLSRKPREPAPR